MGLLSKTTSLQVHDAFLYFSLPLLQDYAVDMPNFLFSGGREHLPACRRLLFPLLHAEKGRATTEKGDVCTQAT